MARAILEDSRNQLGKHAVKHSWWEAHGVPFKERYCALPYGDYAPSDGDPRVAVDTKASIAELANNIGREHERFRNECIKAQNEGVQLIILIDDKHVQTLDDIDAWISPTCRRCVFNLDGYCNPLTQGECALYGKRSRPFQGERMRKALNTMTERYGVQFEFCDPRNSAKRICEYLDFTYDDKA